MDKNTILKKIRSRVTKGQEWLVDNIQYLTLMGSHAYGTHHENSDWDVYGFTMPPIEYLFPDNIIFGYDNLPKFDQFQGQFKEGAKKEHLDFQIYNITKYFRLVEDNNPNMIDSLFTKPNCVLIETEIGRMVRENRKLFLHKGSWHRFKGYAYSQLRKIKTDSDKTENPERKELIEKYGYDTKFAVHIFRLLDECDQILTTGDIDLTRNREQLKSVLKGFYTLEEVVEYFKGKEILLQKAYEDSELPWGPDIHHQKIRSLLKLCIDRFYFGGVTQRSE